MTKLGEIRKRQAEYKEELPWLHYSNSDAEDVAFLLELLDACAEMAARWRLIRAEHVLPPLDEMTKTTLAICADELEAVLNG